MSDLFTHLARHAELNGEQIALQGEQDSLSYRALYERVCALSERLKTQSVGNLGLYCDNEPLWVVVQLAAMKAGIAVTPIPLFFSQAQIQHLFEQSQIDLLFSHNNLAQRLPGIEDWVAAEVGEQGEWFRPRQRVAKDTGVLPGTALVTFTSGTTGQPKGVCIGAALLNRVCESLYEVIGAQSIAHHLCLLPLPVMLENVAGVMLPLRAGATISLLPSHVTGLSGSSGLEVARLARCLMSQRPESLILTPELLKVLVHLAAQGTIPDSLKFVAVGGGRTAPALLQRALDLGIPVYEGYGLSECGSVVSLNQPAAQRIGSTGRPLSHVQVEISECGEVVVRGPVMLGYLGEPAASESGVHTGDLGYLDEEGFLHITGRRKNVQINSFGRNFSPEWIESEINLLPGVAASAVFGDQRAFIAAVVDLVPGAVWSEFLTALQALNQRLPDYARILAPIPAATPFSPANQQLTANGRIRRETIYAAYSTQIEGAEAFQLSSNA